jgi:hypothetical protein
MSSQPATKRDNRRFRLAANHNETVAATKRDNRRFRLAANHNETVAATA